jgi:hypothetical protein
VIRHVSVLTFTADAGADQMQAITAALSTLPGRLPALRAYNIGPDIGLSDGNGSFVVVADFDDTAGYESYRDDPEHQRILAELIRPVLAARAAAQYEIA